jgi:methionine-rich copper-binding protein CopC
LVTPLLGVFVLSVLVFGGSPALAHNVVENYTPEPGSTVTESPVDISLTSNDLYLDLAGDGQGFGIVVRDSQGLYYGDGCYLVDERTLSASVELGEAGTYEIVYQFVSADGHSPSESYTFEFAPAASHSPAVGYETPAECGVARELASEETTPETVVTASSSEGVAVEQEPRDPMLIVGFLSIVSIAVVVWVVWRVRQKRNGN